MLIYIFLNPYWIALSKISIIFSELFGFNIFKFYPFLTYFIISLIQLLAYNWGSIISGHLLLFSKIIALSMEKESLGNFY